MSSFSKETLTTAIIYCDHFDFIVETSKKKKEERFFKLRLAEWVNGLWGTISDSVCLFLFLLNCRKSVSNDNIITV